jgi:hypothetical protein
LGRSSRRGSASGASQYASVSDGNSLFNSAIAEQPKEESSELSDAPANAVLEPKIQRLINWNVAIFQELLEEIAAQRIATEKSDSKISENIASRGQHIRDDVVESINMPSYNAYATAPLGSFKASSHNKLDPRAIIQLREYITKIATFYHSDNGFHNFAHASHVIMSTIKLLQRIATPDVKKKECENEQEFFKYTYGISSDPLTKLGIVWSALVHDVDHQGVSNFQLAKEKDSMAVAYDNKSVLEQHSLGLSWSLLMEPSFKDLRKAIYATQEEYDRFRQLTINCVMATDIFDKELKSFRDGRWEKAFKLGGHDREGHGGNFDNAELTDSIGYSDHRVNNDADWERKATIVIECIIQASDVAHTMQHWHVYQRWNKCLFTEMYAAYKAGRAEKDPSLGWYEGELWFFDNYIIPLASKLRECQVFGVSCDEFLDFATENRKEWSVKGRDIVAQMVEDVAGSYNCGTHDEVSL